MYICIYTYMYISQKKLICFGRKMFEKISVID